jgi:hypothetical protein
MKRVKLIALVSSLLIALVATVAWKLWDLEATNVVLTAITTIATVIMAVTIYQLDLTLQQLRFEALNKVYDFLSNDVKRDLNDISNWARERRKPEDVFIWDSSGENWGKVRFVSVAFNKIGYYVYKGFLDEEFIQEEFGGLVVRSFVAIRPYLQYMREKSEPKDKPWFMRRFYLLVVIVCEQYLREKKEFKEYLEKIVNEYGDESTKRDYKNGSLVPIEWLADDVKRWLKKKGYLKKISKHSKTKRT